MQIPKALNIVGKTFAVKRVKDLKNDEGELCYGLCDSSKQMISIDPQYPAQMQDSTLLHEVIEAINIMFELGLRHKQIMTLEAGLYQVLKDNKLHFDKVGD